MIVSQTEIIVTKEGSEIARKRVSPGIYLIGCGAGCDLLIEDDLISPRHARLTVAFDYASVEDIGSDHGTRVNGKPVTGKARLWPGQRIEIGRAAIELRRPEEDRSSGELLPPNFTIVRRALARELLRNKKYQVGELIAQGGMGAILGATEAATGRTVAMKVMLQTPSSDAVMRFIAEAKVTAHLEHPNIVPVHELSIDEEDQVFYTMKFIQGVTLGVVLEKLRHGDPATLAKYPLAVLLTVFQKVCDALAFAHSKGVIHRDLKPENVMIGDYGEVLVMDWGLSKVQGSDAPAAVLESVHDSAFATLSGQILGTPQYMSPEQARGEIDGLDARTDIYALGAILYHILALRPAVSGHNLMEVVDKVGRGETIPLAEAAADRSVRLSHLPGRSVPQSLEAVVGEAMAFQPEKRYPKVEALQADITAYQHGFATGAEHASARKQLTLLIKRHRAVSTSIAAGLVLLAGISAAFTVRLLSEKNIAVGAKLIAEEERRHAEQSLGTADQERKRAEGALGTAEAERQRAQEALGTAKAEGARAEAEKNHAEEARRNADEARHTAEEQRKRAEAESARAEQALGDLKKTAPTFFALARSLLDEGKFAEAIEKTGYAIQLDDSNADYHLFRANLLEAAQELAGAAQEYRRVLALRPRDEAAKANLALCERLLAANGPSSGLSKESQKQLLTALRQQNRMAEAGALSALIEPNIAAAESTLRARLRDYRKQPGWDDTRLTRKADGSFRIVFDHLWLGDLSILKGQPISELSFSNTDLADLSSLEGLPLKRLILNYAKVSDLGPLHGMPLESLDLAGLPVSDLSPLKGMELRHLTISYTQVSDLAPLAKMPLKYLSANDTRIRDLAPLRQMPLAYVNCSTTDVTDLAPLAGAPLDFLDASNNRIENVKALASCPTLRTLLISHTLLKDLAPLTKLQLTELDFSQTNVAEVGPLHGQPLKKLNLGNTQVTDLTPLADCNSLEEITIPYMATNVNALRNLMFLHFISTGEAGERRSQTAAEFWKEYEANKNWPRK